ncbi:TetR/AcrR family transcriptional regulator [Jeotgalicoccus huakuii]|uniref:TetR/AcrR family transcriptional regulator n=1 Tax=unclassified Jeotgalicoccus TaxID=2630462 RepID=UPI001414DA8B|nr:MULTISPECIES: TetR/AcrR family transcriptional regulator [unclassified Jeotgalicoccus]MCK1976412.1 TetR/AcrR family transcriptional regulator [Jeotgalicoccus huakuii]QQD84411.1 TetR/AcrR family transcriptional regulator [Jeotgalicoccus sp. ATCC 8456]
MLQKSLTRENLIEAFWELYKDKPIEKITVKEITNRAGYNRGTFYAYFKDTYEVLKEIKESIMPSKDMIIYPIQRIEKKEDLIFDTLSHSNDYFMENQEKIIVLLGPEGDPSFVHELKIRTREILMEYLNGSDINEPEKIQFIIEYHMSAIIGVFQLWVERGSTLDQIELEKLIEDISQDGVISILQTLISK